MAKPVRVKIAASGSGEVRKEAQKSEGAIKDLAGGVAKWGGAVAVATGALAVSAVNDFAEMDKGIREVATLIPDATQETVDALTDQINAVRTTMGQEGEAVTKAFYDSLSAGVSQEAVPEFVEAAGQLATATGSDIATAVDLGTTALNAFGLATDEASRINDIMFATIQSGKTTLPELASAYAHVAAPANALGVSVAETNAMLAALTLQGVPTAQAATQIKAAFNELSKETGKGLGKTFKELAGVNFKQFIAAGGTVEEALAMIHQHAADTGTEIVALAGSSEAANAVLLSGGTSAGLYAGALENIGGSAGAVTEGFETMAGGVAFQMAQFQESLKVAKEELGAFVAPIAAEIMPVILGLVDALGPVVKALVGPLGRAVGAVLPVIESLIDALAGPLETVLTAVGEAIAVLAETLGPHITPIIETLANLFADVLVVAIDTLLPIVTSLINILGPVLTEVIQKLAPIVLKLFETLGPMVGEMLMAVMPLISALADVLSGTLMEVIKALLPVVNTLLEQLGPIIMDIITTLVPIIQDLAGTLGTILVEALNILLPIIGDLLEELGPVIRDVLNTLLPIIGDLVDILGDVLLDAIQLLLPIIADLVKASGAAHHRGHRHLVAHPGAVDGGYRPPYSERCHIYAVADYRRVVERVGAGDNRGAGRVDAGAWQSLGDLLSTVLAVAFKDLLPPIIDLLALLY